MYRITDGFGWFRMNESFQRALEVAEIVEGMLPRRKAFSLGVSPWRYGHKEGVAIENQNTEGRPWRRATISGHPENKITVYYGPLGAYSMPAMEPQDWDKSNVYDGDQQREAAEFVVNFLSPIVESDAPQVNP